MANKKTELTPQQITDALPNLSPQDFMEVKKKVDEEYASRKEKAADILDLLNGEKK